MIQSPKGTRDFFPHDERIQQYIFSKWEEICLSFGYEPYEGPTFEHLEMYTDKSGDEIVDQLYTFRDKGGRDLALRPEMTPSLARMVASQGRNLPKPVKWFCMPRLFRYERAQKGRLREFFQLNMDILGTDSTHAETDLLTAIVALMEAFGLKRSDFRIGVSSRRLLNAVLEQMYISETDVVYAAFDRRAKIDAASFRKMLVDGGLSEKQQLDLETFVGCKTVEELEPLCGETGSEAWYALQDLRDLFVRMRELGYGECVTLDLGIVRGLAYYTGIVFEVFDVAKSMRAIAGGGRYDDLCARLGRERVTGVGFGMGDVVLRNLLEEKGLLPDMTRNRLDYWIISFQNDFLKMFLLATELRKKGLKVGHALEPKSFSKRMQEADRSGAKKVILLGSDQAGEGEVEIKDLRDGTQVVVAIDSL